MNAVHALRGAIGFLSRVPVGRDERAWEAFRSTPAAFPVAGYLVGAALSVPVAVPALAAAAGSASRSGSAAGPALGPPALAPAVALLFVATAYAVTGIAHLDGLADLGDAAVVHGDAERRLSVAADSRVGVGGALAVALAVVGLALAGLALASVAVGPAAAGDPATALRLAGLVVAAEVAAKTGMVAVAGLGTPSHDGMGAAVAGAVDRRSLAVPLVLAAPAAALTWPSPAAAAALLAGLVVAAGVLRWARRTLGGVNGDVFGATNELARLAGLHAGVVAWTLS